MAKMSIPVTHSAVALYKLCAMPYNGAASIFIRILLDKKYSLPYRVIDAVVAHFTGFLDDTRVLPVLWHQALLTLLQRYKNQTTGDQKALLRKLFKVHEHHLITAESRRELVRCANRGDKEPSKKKAGGSAMEL